jgi:tetratricopeptide (TPR) repeat protein
MTTSAGMKSFRPAWIVGLILAGAVAAYAWTRVGLFDLPTVPGDVTLSAAGLNGLPAMKQLDDALHAPEPGYSPQAPVLSPAAASVRAGLSLIQSGRAEEGLGKMREGIESEPANLVLANAYRMVAFQLRRDLLLKLRATPTITFPAWIEKEPLEFFEILDKRHPSRETKLNLALAWVDLMLLFPALEIKAPSSVESVKILTQLIDGSDAYYIPALYGRGLNHLHRPARLVWPEADKTPPDAAARDIARAIAVGRKFGVGSPRLQATLAISLGDAYVKVGKNSNARSWWQIAQNLCPDASIQAAVRRRYAWKDEEILDRLEEELDRARGALDAPMTDLRIMWE